MVWRRGDSARVYHHPVMSESPGVTAALGSRKNGQRPAPKLRRWLKLTQRLRGGSERSWRRRKSCRRSLGLRVASARWSALASRQRALRRRGALTNHKPPQDASDTKNLSGRETSEEVGGRLLRDEVAELRGRDHQRRFAEGQRRGCSLRRRWRRSTSTERQ